MTTVDQIKSIINKNFNTSGLSVEFITEESLKKNSEILDSSEYFGFNYLSVVYHDEYNLSNYQGGKLSINIFNNNILYISNRINPPK
jgi:hypothetical protein